MFDGAGLALVVLPSGAKSWRLFDRHADGRQRTTTLGLYPGVGLAEARRRALAAREVGRTGEGGTAPKRTPPPPILTLRQACLDYWKGRQDVTEGYRSNAIRGLELHAWPELGARTVESVTRADVLRVLLALDAKGHHPYVRKVRLWLCLALDRCVELDLVPANVARSINPERAFGRKPVEHHAAVTLGEVPELMERLALEKDLQSVLAMRLLALTWVRTAELRGMMWSEIEGARWLIGAKRMKRNRDHLVPLSSQALGILEALKARTGSSHYVFQAPHRGDRPMSENAILALLARMGYKGRHTGHGWRTVASTWANESGYSPDAIERQLAHAPDDQVRAAYNRAEFMPERSRMLQAWADWLMPA